MNVQRQPGANVIAVVDSIKALLPQLRETLPPSLDVAVLTDRTLTIRASVRDVQIELTFAVVLVVGVIFLFLGDWRATLIPSLSVPLSLIGTLAVMYLAGFSLNNLSIMALTIATGFVVDDAIVMIENIARYIERGDDPKQAALEGSGQIAFTVVSLTVSLIAVLIPLLFMSDVVGRLFSEFAVTLSVTILISAVVSLTLVPMLCAQLLRRRPGHAAAGQPQSHLEAEALGARWFGRMISFYDRCLIVVFRHQPLTLADRRRHHRADRRALHRDPQGLLPGPGHRPDPGRHRGAAKRLLRGDERAPARARRRHPGRSRRREPDLVRRRRRHQPDAQLGPHADQPEAARRPQRHARARSSGACSARPRACRASRSTCSRRRTSPSIRR